MQIKEELFDFLNEEEAIFMEYAIRYKIQMCICYSCICSISIIITE